MSPLVISQHRASNQQTHRHSHTQTQAFVKHILLIQLKTSNRSTSRQKVANTHANRPTRNLSPDKTWTQSWIKGNSSSSNSSNHCPPFRKHHCTRTMPTRSVLRQTGNSHTIDKTCSTRRMGTIPTRKHQRHGLTIRHYSPPHPQQVVNPHNSQKNQNSARDHLTPCAVASPI